jgi:uncharacterized protein YrzB (UPF0473 family)
MKQLMHNMSNEELFWKIENEGAEYFFLSYISIDAIKDEDLKKAVQRLKLEWEKIEEVVDDLEMEYGGYDG